MSETLLRNLERKPSDPVNYVLMVKTFQIYNKTEFNCWSVFFCFVVMGGRGTIWELGDWEDNYFAVKSKCSPYTHTDLEMACDNNPTFFASWYYDVFVALQAITLILIQDVFV